ncbi:oligopeptide/dipeptide ABC transporter ATP-binding protein [Microbacterium soli]|uniref:Dipeptide ABC transporter ATP-binding protein n=1 Tax=Microbacterium soli TaxID=446075 RepID=A0ABP7MVJ4_9MICO
MTDIARVSEVSRLYRARGGREAGGRFRAVDGVSFTIPAGETLGLVGESGSGKSTVGRVLIGMEKPDEGVVRFEGEDISRFSARRRKQFLRDVSMVFQDPFSALDPRWTIQRIIAEPLTITGDFTAQVRREKVLTALRHVGLGAEHLGRRPREFSGGQRQRIAIARALVSEPKLIVCDESVSALDVSTQAQVLGLLKELQDRLGVSYLFISHDLHVVRRVSERIAVMYLGRIVEEGPAKRLVDQPLHPYTAALVSAAPIPDPARARANRRIILSGVQPSVVDPPSGCMFRTRCPLAMDICSRERPAWRTVADGRRVACHLHGRDGAANGMLDVAAMMRSATRRDTGQQTKEKAST